MPEVTVIALPPSIRAAAATRASRNLPLGLLPPRFMTAGSPFSARNSRAACRKVRNSEPENDLSGYGSGINGPGESKSLLRSLAVLAQRIVRRWIVVAFAVTVAVIAGIFSYVAASSSDSGPRAVTADEASRLAIARFRNYQKQGRAVTISVPGAAGELVITGSADYRAKSGYGVLKGKGRNDSGNGLIRWNATRVELRPLPVVPDLPPANPPADGWVGRPLNPEAGTLDRALAILLGLGSDRPDNAQLLPQNGAERVAADQVNGHAVDVFTGPDSRERPGSAESVRYWLDGDGVMYRVRTSVPGEKNPVVIDFDTHEFIAVPSGR
ncbi:hypothetical protein ABT279_14840 [Amycolatopsis sp. NPDC000673]|uniref:hypothetical protein n=1 Tax=Amycolatopsis sp. NPDC000673 TaxID=3154267 RepID=UPI00331C94C7